MKNDCIILAAGLSSRMGQWKPVMTIDGKSLIKHSIDRAREVCDNIVIVGGYRYEDLKNHLSDYGKLQMVNNQSFEEGMITSLKAGLPFIKSDSFFVTLADMPYISSSTFIKMGKTDFQEVLFPLYKGKRGHPVLIHRGVLKEYDFNNNYRRIKEILLLKHVTEVNVSDPGIILDIDTPKDFPAD